MLRDAPTGAWLLAAVVAAAAHDSVPHPRWLIIHLLLVGAVGHSVVVWSQHFADALLKTRAVAGWIARLETRLIAMNAGAALVFAGVLAHQRVLTWLGAAAVAGAAVLHAVVLARQMRGALPAPFAPAVRFYIAAAATLPAGVAAGVAVTRVAGTPLHDRLHIAHVAVNVFGWIGITILGTLVTLWPTVLGATIDQRTAARSLGSLPLLVGGIALVAAGAVADARALVVLGFAAYLAGAAVVTWGLIEAARQRSPRSFAAYSIGAGVLWWLVALVYLTVAGVRAPTWEALAEEWGRASPYLAAAVVAQVLMGALSYLIPAVLRSGSEKSTRAQRELDRWAAWRAAVVNAALAVTLFPVPHAIWAVAAVVVVLSVAGFIVVMVRATVPRRAPRG